MRTFIIAEAGVNHNGDMATALRMVALSKECGADAVKFQLFKDRPEIEHLRLTEDDMVELYGYCQATGIEFMCTPFYVDAVKFLDPVVKRHKLASSWVHMPELMDLALRSGKPVIASMGMASDRDILKYSYYPQVSALHCVSKYPCPDEEAALDDVKFEWCSGYSDHTVGTLACLGAVALGAQIIEKHFTLDKTQEGPDHACSAEPEEFAQMVRDIRRLEKML